MVIALLYCLLYIACVVLSALVVVWAIENIAGYPIPARIKQVGMVILVLLCLIAVAMYVPFPAMPLPGHGHWVP